ncbi:GNAT family N-acetyltransferase [Tranquillimonas alkanivorans]|uniref:Putative acetyltransferase n=1 Tax=Tranquillimonas alkanivorans TaxID=441119 RepID=A0A1I5U3S4_9RHOB|nr:GNAT family N-acetyltransferase [Tranquillimonas alkanivorans]SFP89942.1 putative acetyltransferase [Tranquillimonas alkanivorans]
MLGKRDAVVIATAMPHPPPRLRSFGRSGDAAACLRIWRRAAEAGHPFLGPRDLDQEELLLRHRLLPAADVTLAEVDGVPVGFVALVWRLVAALFVDPAHHRHSIGRHLLEHAAQAHPALAVEVYEDNANARAFYAACGFRQVGRRPQDALGRPHALLQLERAFADTRARR